MKRLPWILLVVACVGAALLPAALAADDAVEDPTNPIALIKTTMGDIRVELFAKETPQTVENFLGLAEGTKEWTVPGTSERVKRPFFDGLIFHRVIPGFMIQGGCPLGTGTGDPGYRFDDEINATSLGLAEIKVLDGGRPHPWLQIRSQPEFQQKILQPLFAQMGIGSQADLDARKSEVEARVNAMTLKEAYELAGYRYEEDAPSHAPKRGVLAMANSGPNTNGSQFFINLGDTPHLTGKHTVFGHVVGGMDVVEAIGKVKTGLRDKPLEDVKILSIRRVTD